jgi:hypothetical protein
MLQALYFDNLMSFLKQKFEQVTGHRNQLNSTKPLADALISGLAVFSLKDRSLLQFIDRLKERSSNLKSIFKINTVISDTAVRQFIDPADPTELKTILCQPTRMLLQHGLLQPYQCVGGCMLVAVDGTGYFSSKTLHCENCCEKHHRDGSMTYYHNALSAAVVKAGEREVFPLTMEEMTSQDGTSKNDGEPAAIKRLLPQLRQAMPQRMLIVTEDALYANGPHIHDLQAAGLRFIIRIKEGYPLIQFDNLLKQGGIHRFTLRDKDARE